MGLESSERTLESGPNRQLLSSISLLVPVLNLSWPFVWIVDVRSFLWLSLPWEMQLISMAWLCPGSAVVLTGFLKTLLIDWFAKKGSNVRNLWMSNFSCWLLWLSNFCAVKLWQEHNVLIRAISTAVQLLIAPSTFRLLIINPASDLTYKGGNR